MSSVVYRWARPPGSCGVTMYMEEKVLESDLLGFQNSYDEHWKKAVKALGDPTQCKDINGWVGELISFATQCHDEAIRLLNHGEKLSKIKNPGVCVGLGDVEQILARRITNIQKLKEENYAVAKKNGITLR